MDGVATGSPLGPLMANTFMSSNEAKLEADGNIYDFYKRFVDDTFTVVPGIATAETLHQALNNAHPSVSFTMEIEMEGKLPFLGMTIIREENTIHIRRSTESRPTYGSYFITKETRTSDTREAY